MNFDWTIHPDEVLMTIGVLIAYLTFRSDRKAILREQEMMHAQNQLKLQELLQAHNDQKEINSKLDAQIRELQAQTREMIRISEGIDKRLRLQEELGRRPRV